MKLNGSQSLLNFDVIKTSINLNENGLPNFVIRQEKTSSNSNFIITSFSHYNSSNDFCIDNSNIKVGDCLLSINGQSLSNEDSLSNVLALLKGAPRSQVHLILKRASFDNQKSFCMKKIKQPIKNQNNDNEIYVNEQDLVQKPSPKQRSNIEQTNLKLDTIADLEFKDTRFDGLVEVINFFY